MTYDEYKKDLESQEAKVHEIEDEIDRLKDEERMKKLEEMANVDAPKKKRA
jgi:cell division protein FtsB